MTAPEAPAYPMYGLTCPRCGYPGVEWSPGRYIKHGARRFCLLTPDPVSRRPRTVQLSRWSRW